jgi:alpha-beta hydrolase superfamily lysophospholipase
MHPIRKKSTGFFRVLGIGLIAAAVLFLLVSIIATKIVYDKQFPRYNRPDESTNARLRYSDIEADYARVLVTFRSGDNALQGYVYGMENTRGLMVVAHGLGGGADSYLPEIKHFVDQGLRVFAYDCTGSYNSEGKTTKGFPQSVLDLQAALTYIATQPDLSALPLLLFGHSWGGYAVANVLNFPHDIKGIISASGVNTAIDIIIEQGRTFMGGFIYTQYPFLWLYQRLLYGKVASFDAVTALNATGVPALILHGVADKLVAYEGSALIAHKDEITNPHVEFITLAKPGRDGHSNLFKSEAAASYINGINREYRKLYDSYEGQIPYELKKSFYDGLDRFLVQELDPDLMQLIDGFIDRLVPGTKTQ